MSALAEATEHKTNKSRKRRPTGASSPSASAPAIVAASVERLPYLLDLYPLETPDQTRLSAFFEALRRGRFTTTRCRKDGKILWPPRAVCPVCHTTELEWIDLPSTGRIYAFSAILAGAPVGQEADLPRVVGLVELDGVSLRLFGRIVGADWRECRIGLRVRVEPMDLADGRAYYAFRVIR
jgi:uncharacterized protein